MNTDTPPPRYGTRRNPKTGAMETYQLPDEVDLMQARKELSDMLHGGGWFDDPLARRRRVDGLTEAGVNPGEDCGQTVPAHGRHPPMKRRSPKRCNLPSHGRGFNR